MQHAASVRYREDPRASLLTARDALEGGSSRRLERELRRNEQRRILLVIDLRAVTSVCAAAVEMLLAAQGRARRQGRCLWVLPSPAVHEAVEAAGVAGLVAFASADELDGWLPRSPVAD
jgi:anti-anti-sigma regulatory factor